MKGIVDIDRLNACCASEADAIRAKTHSIKAINYDFAGGRGFAEAIANIAGGDGDEYEGDYTVTPQLDSTVILQTEGKRMSGNVTVLEIPIHSVVNPSGGNTVTIGEVI